MPLHALDGKILIGWHEWCTLPELGIPAIKAKIDTGARTSAIHAFDIYTVNRHDREYVHFKVHPLQKNIRTIVECKALVIDQRAIMSSNGHIEHRYVISTPITLGSLTWNIELTLSNRDPLRFRMLLGRAALQEHVLIDPTHMQNQGRMKPKELRLLYPKAPKNT